MELSFSERGYRYAKRVIRGEVVAGKWCKAACRRFIDDVEREKQGWDYRFNHEKANQVCTFLECLPHIKGVWDVPTIVLSDWQIFITVNLFGWQEVGSNLRRFRRFYLEVARKNGKSAWAAGIALWLTFLDGEPGADVYSFATSLDQAAELWGVAKAMIEKDPSWWGDTAAYSKASIYSLAANSRYVPLSGVGRTKDGFNAHGFIADELHAHTSRALWDVMDSSTGARRQPLGGAITTAGSDRSGVCFEIRGYVLKVLNATLHRHDGLGYPVTGETAEDDRYFGVIYTIDEDDDTYDESVWQKANPNLNVSVFLESLQSAAAIAKATPSREPEFLTKRLNVWVNSEHAWLDLRAWDKCADPTLTLDDFEGEECIIGLDLAAVSDIAAAVKVFRRGKKYYVFTKFYLPELVVETSSNSQYKGWAKQGYITATEGARIDLDFVELDLKKDHDRFKVLELPFDPYQAQQLSGRMLAEGAEMVQVSQNVSNHSEPMKWLEALVLSGDLVHTGCPVLMWMISNIVVRVDANDNIYPRKAHKDNKIDGVVALIMAIGRWIVHEPEDNLDDFINNPVKTN